MLPRGTRFFLGREKAVSMSSSDSSSYFVIGLLAAALLAIVIHAYTNFSSSRARTESFDISDPAEYHEEDARPDPPAVEVDDPDADELSPRDEYHAGTPGPAALAAGHGPLLDNGDLDQLRPRNPAVHGTQPAETFEPFAGGEYNPW